MCLKLRFPVMQKSFGECLWQTWTDTELPQGDVGYEIRCIFECDANADSIFWESDEEFEAQAKYSV